MANVNQVNPIPAGYSTVVPYISVKSASDAIAFYKKAFGAEEVLRMPMPDGKVGHAELKIGDSIVMLADEMDHPDAISKSPRTLGGVTSGLCLYVADCDALFNRSVEAGGKVRRGLVTGGAVTFGVSWGIAVSTSFVFSTSTCGSSCSYAGDYLWIPIAGPLLVASHDSGSDGPGIFILWSAAEAAGLAMFIIGMMGHDVMEYRVAQHGPTLHLTPLLARAASGMALTASW